MQNARKLREEIRPILDRLERPCYASVLEASRPGEIQYLWQIQVERVQEGEPEWSVLPTVVARVLDREYAKATCDQKKKLQEVICFGVHLNFASEMKFSWLQERSIPTGSSGTRRWQKPQKRVAILNFRWRALELKVEDGPFLRVRCIEVSHETAGTVVPQGQLGDLLQHRLSHYMEASDEEPEQDADDQEDNEKQEAAFQEGFGIEAPPLAEEQSQSDNEEPFLELP